jgi:S-adenosylmethionine-diacylglycerol 3-amino-3-carboxypropyl transferase
MSTISERIHQAVFDGLYGSSLLYNACWEDPACDRAALRLGGDDEVLVITSGGCNALDYALCGPRRVWAVDANPRQTALLELKLAGIHALGHDDFFQIFGRGRHPGFPDLYRRRLRALLSPTARQFWDRRGHWFTGRSFYYRGLSGTVARLVRAYLDAWPALRRAVDDLLDAPSLEAQARIYDARVAPRLWTPPVRWAVGRQATMSMLGVPCAQTREVARGHQHGVSGFICDAIARVFRLLPVGDNYFWTVYLRGGYTPACCPEYLKPANFAALKGGLAERIVPVTGTVAGFLAGHQGRISRFVLLDHMDWMAWHRPHDLAGEWERICQRAAPGTRIIFRSAHQEAGYLAHVRVGGVALPERLRFDRPLAAILHARDRVGTYGGFHIADLAA